MSVSVESKGEIETACSSRVVPGGGLLRLVFTSFDDATAPFSLKVRGPGGQVLVERVLRELPTGKPQSAPAIEVKPVGAGEYRVEIRLKAPALYRYWQSPGP